MIYLDGFFTPEEIENAKKYKYNGKDDSICVKLFLRKYWDFLINYVPLKIAPNLITLIGFSFEVVSFLISFIISHAASRPLPWWVCIFNGISLHIYQTLDNLDGRQARRTGSSSPLGQFFDHGCDAITGVFEMMKVVMSFSMGNTIESYVFVMLMATGFFFTSWEEYNRHAFYLGYINGPDEGLLFLAICHVLAGIFPSFKNIANFTLIQIGFVISASSTILPIIYNVCKHIINDIEKVKQAVISLIPALITISISLVSLFSDHSPISISYYIITSSLVLQYQSQMTIVAFLTLKPAIKLFDYTIGAIWLFMAIPILISSLNEGYYYWCFLTILIIGIMIYFDLGVIFGFSNGLQIPVLTLKDKSDEMPDVLSINPEGLAIEEEEEDKNEGQAVNSNLFSESKDDEA
ncbi:hypothetical protein M9Y10_004861 [Tritrichomonas musculus]|uniref:CDP-alcohol phosphatidyltransferase family protein n=1 Tax=Tritrichomonas musculus TaxID=1915356 RepID=A0ABR2JJQ8_9EUKA